MTRSVQDRDRKAIQPRDQSYSRQKKYDSGRRTDKRSNLKCRTGPTGVRTGDRHARNPRDRSDNTQIRWKRNNRAEERQASKPRDRSDNRQIRWKKE
jgi:hypothetical protein